MNAEHDSTDADPHATCTGNCTPAADDSKKAIGVRGAVIASSLGLVLSACEPKATPDPSRMTTLYGPAPMMKKQGAAGNGAVKEASKPKEEPKPKKGE